MKNNTKQTIMILLLLILFISLAACASNDPGAPNQDEGNSISDNFPGGMNNKDKDIENEKNIMDEFTAVVANNSSIEKLIRFMDNHVPNLKQPNVTQILIVFEQEQRAQKPALDDQYDADNVQEQLLQLYKENFELPSETLIEDEQLKTLITQTKQAGYKVETLEGRFFPVIDYEFYKAYSPYATEDMSAYIDIMATESNEPPAKDNSIVIDWPEVVTRAINQTKFIHDHPDSTLKSSINDLHSRYVYYTLYGLKNTPLFSANNNQLNPEAKSAFTVAIEQNATNDYTLMIKELLNLAKQNSDKLNDDIEHFRNSIVME